jgi:hypothetical protein
VNENNLVKRTLYPLEILQIENFLIGTSRLGNFVIWKRVIGNFVTDLLSGMADTAAGTTELMSECFDRTLFHYKNK